MFCYNYDIYTEEYSGEVEIKTFVTCFGGDLLLVKQDFLLLSIGTLDPSLLPVLGG
jgi:hypothetical protein